MDTSSASVIAITAAQDGLAWPRSIPDRCATVIPALWATASWVIPVLSRSSRIASLHRTEVSQLERGLRLPRIDTLVKLTSSLEVSADELLDGIAWKVGSFRYGQFQAVEDDH